MEWLILNQHFLYLNLFVTRVTSWCTWRMRDCCSTSIILVVLVLFLFATLLASFFRIENALISVLLCNT
jgi:hypothetical protein